MGGKVALLCGMIENDCRVYLLQKADKYAEQAGLSVATVSRKCHGDCDFLEQFRQGKVSTTLRKYDAMLAFFSINASQGPELKAVRPAKKIAVGKKKAA